MARKPKDLETGDDLRESIQHLDQVSSRISRLLTELAAPKPTPAGDDQAEPSARSRARHFG
jgi:hypothetical protein